MLLPACTALRKLGTLAERGSARRRIEPACNAATPTMVAMVTRRVLSPRATPPCTILVCRERCRLSILCTAAAPGRLPCGADVYSGWPRSRDNRHSYFDQFEKCHFCSSDASCENRERKLLDGQFGAARGVARWEREKHLMNRAWPREGAYLETWMTLSAHLQTVAGELIGARERVGSRDYAACGCVPRFEGYPRHPWQVHLMLSTCSHIVLIRD